MKKIPEFVLNMDRFGIINPSMVLNPQPLISMIAK